MPEKEKNKIKLIRGVLGVPSGGKDKLVFTKKGVIYLKKLK